MNVPKKCILRLMVELSLASLGGMVGFGLILSPLWWLGVAIGVPMALLENGLRRQLDDRRAWFSPEEKVVVFRFSALPWILGTVGGFVASIVLWRADVAVVTGVASIFWLSFVIVAYRQLYMDLQSPVWKVRLQEGSLCLGGKSPSSTPQGW